MSKILQTNFAGVTFENPVTTASGTFGSGLEYQDFVDLKKLGAVTTKGVANVPWQGNPTPRIAETHGGMLNAIGLQNPGIDTFIKRDLAYLNECGARVIVNVCGHSTEEYVEVVERLADEKVDLLEINISCPNVKEGGIAFGQKAEAAEAICQGMCDHLGAAYAAPAATEPADTGKLYRVQIGAFAVKANAEAMLAKAKAAGFADAFIAAE